MLAFPRRVYQQASVELQQETRLAIYQICRVRFHTS